MNMMHVNLSPIVAYFTMALVICITLRKKEQICQIYFDSTRRVVVIRTIVSMKHGHAV